ncbi:hypothetical protein J4219_04390 [Candidatus Woesearchaeota archaeon]|nr:hypothetical protein [Candidatus Woesearchaeota archaeon]
MATTIQISEELHKKLEKRKLFSNESFEDVIWDLIEDTQELSEETKRSMEKSREEIKLGKVHTFEQVKKRLKL